MAHRDTKTVAEINGQPVDELLTEIRDTLKNARPAVEQEGTKQDLQELDDGIKELTEEIASIQKG